MVARSDLGLRRMAVLVAALIVGLGCGGGGKSEPEDLSSIATDDSSIEEPALDSSELSESSPSDVASTEAEVAETPDLSPPPEAPEPTLIDEPAPNEDSLPESTASAEDISPVDSSVIVIESGEDSKDAEDNSPVDSSVTVIESGEDAKDAEDTSPVDFTVTVIESGEDALPGEDMSLLEAAAAERARRGTAPPTKIVITNKNLSDYAVGQLTVAEAGQSQTISDANAAVLEERRAEEEYWRSGVLEIRMAWADAAERVDDLEAEVFHLRQRFYAEDDGFYRDSQIKPAWDRAIEQLQESNREILERQEELTAFLDKGREAGALPGWLREGVDLEPERRQEEEDVYIEPDRNRYEPGEPVIVEESGQGPRR